MIVGTFSIKDYYGLVIFEKLSKSLGILFWLCDEKYFISVFFKPKKINLDLFKSSVFVYNQYELNQFWNTWCVQHILTNRPIKQRQRSRTFHLTYFTWDQAVSYIRGDPSRSGASYLMTFVLVPIVYIYLRQPSA